MITAVVRLALRQDSLAILDLIDQLGYGVDHPRHLALLTVLMKRDEHAMLVAEADGKVVGFANINFRAFLRYGDLVATLDELCVDQSYRDRGIGRQLVEAALAEARRRGAQHLELTTNNRRVDALRCYRRLGFEVTSHKLVYPLHPRADDESQSTEVSHAH